MSKKWELWHFSVLVYKIKTIIASDTATNTDTDETKDKTSDISASGNSEGTNTVNSNKARFENRF